MNNDPQLPDEVIAAIHAHHTVEAIKLLREHTGLGLKEAKDAVEAYQRDQSYRGSDSGDMYSESGKSHDTELPFEVVAAIRAHRKIEAIKLLRERTSLGLKQAKDAVEAYQRDNPMYGGSNRSNLGSETGIGRVVLLLLLVAVLYGAYQLLF